MPGRPWGLESVTEGSSQLLVSGAGAGRDYQYGNKSQEAFWITSAVHVSVAPPTGSWLGHLSSPPCGLPFPNKLDWASS